MPLYLPAATAAPELLETVAYNPGVASEPSTGSTSFVDVDASNLLITFTVPSSGNVVVELTGLCVITTSGRQRWGLREASSDVSGSGVFACSTHFGGDYYAVTRKIRLTGLTGGASKTYKWSFLSTSGNTAYMAMGGIFGAAVMQVWSD